MPETKRHGPRSLVGQQFHEIHELGVFSFCPDSNDASTPAKQVHISIQMEAMAHAVSGAPPLPPLIMRCHGTATLDDHIEALMEHRTYVCGKHEWRNDWPVQPSGAQEGKQL